MKKVLSIFLILNLIFAIACKTEESYNYRASQININPEKALLNVIPQPLDVKLENGSFSFARGFYIAYSDKSFQKQAIAFARMMEPMFPEGLRLVLAPNPQELKGKFLLLQKNSKKDSYEIKINPSNIVINVDSLKSLAYALSTLRQLLPAEIETKSYVVDTTVYLKSMTIKDSWNDNIRGLYVKAKEITTNKQRADLGSILSLLKLNACFVELNNLEIDREIINLCEANFAELVPVFVANAESQSFLTSSNREILNFATRNKVSKIMLRDSKLISEKNLQNLKSTLNENKIQIIFDDIKQADDKNIYLWNNMLEQGFSTFKEANSKDLDIICFPEYFSDPYKNIAKTINKFGGLSYSELYHKSAIFQLNPEKEDFTLNAIVAISNKTVIPGYNPIEGLIAFSEITWGNRLAYELEDFKNRAELLEYRFEISKNSFYQKRENKLDL